MVSQWKGLSSKSKNSICSRIAIMVGQKLRSLVDCKATVQIGNCEAPPLPTADRHREGLSGNATSFYIVHLAGEKSTKDVE